MTGKIHSHVLAKNDYSTLFWLQKAIKGRLNVVNCSQMIAVDRQKIQCVD
ncbi:hypothetical protein HRJ35_15920 [Shewanella oneidensis MR-1]|nr:hypothetical protein [Shewanella oneidensis]MDX5999672.1 hypothetical protein [Shewanella oneidensis]MEE2029754.1 hypothetical protein [Shewanella oneidensis]QKG97342.1 hypothetical protein HRJ35_15920 [Shewanella oneidensis MR-1]